jgi:ABC-type polysaccharide/polyol phosphate export permease
MTLIALGVGMILCAYCLRYRDINHLWAIATQIFFWLTPITYAYHVDQPIGQAFVGLFHKQTITTLRQFFDIIVHFQPMSILIHDMRRVLLYPLEQGIPSPLHAVGFTLACFFVFGCGAWIYQRRSPYFIEEY